ncbi:transposase [Mollicutes bacterium LVI A0039]|nr:transposase [Mollicutes bacterium LVI A0039]
MKNVMVGETRLLNRYSRKHVIYQFFIYDADTNVLLEIIEDRSYEKVLEYFQSYFRVGSLSTLTMDMWLPYKNAINNVDPNTKVIIDKFHFVRYIMQNFDNVRLQVMNEVRSLYGVNSVEYKMLKSKLNVRNLRTHPSKLKYGAYNQICKILEQYPTLYLMYMREVMDVKTDCFNDSLLVFSN